MRETQFKPGVRAAHGPIPSGHAVVFKDDNRAHCVLDHLGLVSQRDLMRRNSVHNLPKPSRRPFSS